MKTLKINYNTCKSELCEIGKKYDTDKSSQRNNVTDSRHCHPYTLFYEELFKNKKNEKLKIAELGKLYSNSLLMWKEYFTNSQIYGYLINSFKNKFNNDRIILSNINVTNKDSIINAFNKTNIHYDIIIEDTTHEFEDQIRVIENVYQYLKPGGILIVEDIFKSYNENDYINRLKHLLDKFQDYYFVELDHINRNSTGWDNDKLFILVKGGDVPIFKNTNKLTIITPSYRINNLLQIKNSINFDYIDEWIIVYDGSKITENPNLFENQENNKIKEYLYKGEGIYGNPQRNYALSKITNLNALLYYLDDDNIIHPNLYRLLNIVVDSSKMYSFNQFRPQVDRLRLRAEDEHLKSFVYNPYNQYKKIKGNNININYIDTAMVIIPYSLCKNIKWILDKYEADGYYIKECHRNCKHKHVFIDNDLCYYNKIAVKL